MTGKVHNDTKSDFFLYKILYLVYNCFMQCTCLVHIIYNATHPFGTQKGKGYPEKYTIRKRIPEGMADSVF